MDWFIVTGDDILRDQRFEIVLQFDFDDINDFSALTPTSSLWQCEDRYAFFSQECEALAKVIPRIAPPHPSKAKKLDHNCTVTADLTGVPKHKFHRQRGKHTSSIYEHTGIQSHNGSTHIF